VSGKLMNKFIPLFFILIASCTNSSYLKEDNYYYNNMEGIDYVILPYEPTADDGIILAFRKGIPAELTANELEKINELLHETVYKYNTETKTSWGSDVNPIDLSKYNRQYIAIINENKEKEVFINCFRSSSIRESGYWKNDFVFVSDGGNHFFQVKINLTKQIITMFSVNGYA
jgi:hypothetical protein